MKSPIFSSFNEDRSLSSSTDLCINLFPETVPGPRGPVIGLLLNCPGLTTALAAMGAGPVRATYTAKNGLMYAVSGNGLYSVDASWTATLLGTIATGSGPCSIIDSPTQILVVDGVGGWCWNFSTATFTQVIPNSTTDDTGPNVAIYQDGFGLVNSLNTNEIYQTQYNDLSLFAAPTGAGGSTANNAFVQGNPQNVLTMFDLEQEAWIFKQKGVEVWINQGAPGFAFAQLQGVYLPVGIDAPASIARLNDGLAWLGSGDEGSGVVYLSVGYKHKVISTPQIAEIFRGYSVRSDAIAYTYQQDNHWFYVITFPTANATWCFDLTTGKWHQRLFFSNGAFGREIANCHAFFNGKHVVGDYRNGNIYALDPGTYTDAGAPRKWLRSWSALGDSAPRAPMSFDSLQILMQTGITVPAGTNPQIDLRFSDDGGYTWNGPFQMPAGQTGQTAWRVIQNRLGSTSLTRGLDRIWEISGNDPIGIQITGADWTGGPA